MKTNNRPNHERKLYELRCTKHDDETHVIYSNWDFLKEDTNSRVCDGIYRATGIVKIELTPYDDAEYIEYLEEQVTDTFAKLVSVEELSKQTISTLEKENQELKDQLHMLKALDVENRKLIQENFNKFMEKQFDYENQFLKVVESVVNTHQLEPYDFNTCECGFDCVLPFNCDKSKDILTCYKEHLLQEIKSAMEKGNND